MRYNGNKTANVICYLADISIRSLDGSSPPSRSTNFIHMVHDIRGRWLPLSWDYDDHPGRSPPCIKSSGGWPGKIWRNHRMHAVYIRASVKHSKSRSMKLIGYYCPPPFCNKLWTLEEVCTMLEERKPHYWREVEEEEKEVLYQAYSPTPEAAK